MSLLQSLLTCNKYGFDHVNRQHATDAGHEPEFNCLRGLETGGLKRYYVLTQNKNAL